MENEHARGGRTPPLAAPVAEEGRRATTPPRGWWYITGGGRPDVESAATQRVASDRKRGRKTRPLVRACVVAIPFSLSLSLSVWRSRVSISRSASLGRLSRTLALRSAPLRATPQRRRITCARDSFRAARRSPLRSLRRFCCPRQSFSLALPRRFIDWLAARRRWRRPRERRARTIVVVVVGGGESCATEEGPRAFARRRRRRRRRRCSCGDTVVIVTRPSPRSSSVRARARAPRESTQLIGAARWKVVRVAAVLVVSFPLIAERGAVTRRVRLGCERVAIVRAEGRAEDRALDRSIDRQEQCSRCSLVAIVLCRKLVS